MLHISTEICIINWVLFYKAPNRLQDKEEKKKEKEAWRLGEGGCTAEEGVESAGVFGYSS